jgi:hypothetical protein
MHLYSAVIFSIHYHPMKKRYSLLHPPNNKHRIIYLILGGEGEETLERTLLFILKTRHQLCCPQLHPNYTTLIGGVKVGTQRPTVNTPTKRERYPTTLQQQRNRGYFTVIRIVVAGYRAVHCY